MTECEGCNLGMDWCYLEQSKQEKYQDTCPCKECLLKSACSRMCDKRANHLYLARIAARAKYD